MFLNVNGTIISDPHEIGNKFNTFNTIVAKKLVDKMNKPVTDYKDYLKDQAEKSFHMQPTCPTEVNKFSQDCQNLFNLYC